MPLRSQLSAQKGDLGVDQKGGRSLDWFLLCEASRSRSLAIGHYSVLRLEKRRVEEDAEQHKREVIAVCAHYFTK